MDNFDLKKFVSEKTLLNENAPGFDTRKTGEPLPTLESVQAAYEAKNAEDKVDEKDVEKKVEKVLSDEGGAAGKDPFEELADELGISKLKMMKIIDAMSKVKKHKDGDYILTPITEGVINEGKKSDLDKKLAEIDKVYEKQLDKVNGKKKAKKEIVDEYNVEPHDAPDNSMNSTMDEEEYKY